MCGYLHFYKLYRYHLDEVNIRENKVKSINLWKNTGVIAYFVYKNSFLYSKLQYIKN